VPASHLALTQVVPLTSYSGAYPTAPLTDATAAPFHVLVVAHFWAPAAGAATLTVTSAWGATASARVAFAAGDNAVNATISAAAASGEVSLRCPGSLGAHHVFAVTASLQADGSAAPPLLPALAAEHVVFVAGGIGRGEMIASYLEMVASGVQLGTRFACAPESLANPAFKAAFFRANARDAIAKA
jgi:hypothetical protein